MQKSRVIALVVAAIVTTASFVGAQSAPAGAAFGRAGRGANAATGQFGLLRGITLSAAEKAKIKEVRVSYMAQLKELRESLNPAMQEAQAARQKGDSAAMRAVFERTKDDREKLRALMVQQQADLRAALSPENQTLFDANVQEAKKHGVGQGQLRRGGRGLGGGTGSPNA
jgi:Spy/CpxP family protein refolding chaperone